MSTNEAVIQGTPDLSSDITDDVIFPRISQRKLALEDFRQGLLSYHIWMMLAWRDIKLRYRRSMLGPLWITISMAITVYTMGFLYGRLFHTDLNQYYPYLVSGMLIWALVSTSVVELTDTFTLSDGLLKKIKLPYSLYIHRVITRNFIIFFHNLLVMLPIYFIFPLGAKINFNTLLMLPGLAIIYFNAFIFGMIFALIGARYRDISQIIKNLVQVVFFATPIMWSPSILPEKNQIFVYANPVYSYIELVRAPLTGTAPTLLNLGVALFATLVGTLICAKLFIRYRSRIIYWL